MNPFRRKAVENAIVAVLREQAAGFTLKSIRPMVAELLDGCSPPEIAAAVQSLRYAGKLAWDRLELSDGMKTSAVALSAAEQEGGAASNSAPLSDSELAAAPVAAPGPELGHRKLSAGPHIQVSARQGDERPLELDALKGPAEAQVSGADEAGPDDDDPAERPGSDDDKAGEVNDEAREGSQAEQGPARRQPLPAEGAAGDGPPLLRQEQRAVPGGRLEKPRPDRAHDQPASARPLATKPQLHNAGIHAAITRAAARPIGAPAHEPEIARAVREEVNDTASRRSRARSTGTVRQPLELRKFGIPDMSVGEAIGSMLAEEPRDILLAIERKHPAIWRRCVIIARARGQRPMQVLYAALERGLDQLETEQPAQAA